MSSNTAQRCIAALIAILVCFQSPAYAEAYWVKIASTQSGSIYYADMNSRTQKPAEAVIRPFPIITIWIRGDHSLDNSEKPHESMGLRALNCAGKTIANLSAVTYGANGQVMSNYSDTTDSLYDYRPVTPGSIGEAIWEAACSN